MWIALAVLLHAVLVSSSPAKNSAVAGPAFPVELKFNERIDAQRSRIALILPDHRTRALALLDSKAPDELAATARDVPTGECRIAWQVLADDGHITRGEVPFTVR